MKVILNKTQRPLRISLAGGKLLHLGPGKTGQVSDEAVERESIRKLLEAGTIEIMGDGRTGVGSDAASVPHESTHGHNSTKVVTPKGNR